MSVDRNAVIQIKLQTAGYKPFNGVEDREEVPEDRK